MKFSNNCEWNLWRYPSYKTIRQKILRIYKLAVLSWEHLQRIQWSDASLVTLSPLFVAVGETQEEYLFSRSVVPAPLSQCWRHFTSDCTSGCTKPVCQNLTSILSFSVECYHFCEISALMSTDKSLHLVLQLSLSTFCSFFSSFTDICNDILHPAMAHVAHPINQRLIHIVKCFTFSENSLGCCSLFLSKNPPSIGVRFNMLILFH